MSKALEKIKWLQNVFVTRKEEQHFLVDVLIKKTFEEAIAELEVQEKQIDDLKKNVEMWKKIYSELEEQVDNGAIK